MEKEYYSITQRNIFTEALNLAITEFKKLIKKLEKKMLDFSFSKLNYRFFSYNIGIIYKGL